MTEIDRLKGQIIAVVRLDDLSTAVPLTRALIDAGVRAIEITLTSPNATETIARLYGEIAAFADGTALLGAGSVIEAAQVRRVVKAGAQFVVSPITDAGVIAECQQADVLAIPGAMTPNEIQAAWRLGAAAVKVFPARSMGAAYLKDVLAPLPYLRLIPTGGINAQNLREYFHCGAWAVGVGSELLDRSRIAAEDWDGLRAHAAAFVAARDA